MILESVKRDLVAKVKRAVQTENLDAFWESINPDAEQLVFIKDVLESLLVLKNAENN